AELRSFSQAPHVPDEKPQRFVIAPNGPHHGMFYLTYQPRKSPTRSDEAEKFTVRDRHFSRFGAQDRNGFPLAKRHVGAMLRNGHSPALIDNEAERLIAVSARPARAYAHLSRSVAPQRAQLRPGEERGL